MPKLGQIARGELREGVPSSKSGMRVAVLGFLEGGGWGWRARPSLLPRAQIEGEPSTIFRCSVP